APRVGLARPAGHPDADRRHARPAAAAEARARGRYHRDRAGRWVPLPRPSQRRAEARMTLAGRLHGGAVVLVIAMAVTASIATQRVLRRRWEEQLAAELLSAARVRAPFLTRGSA